MEDRIEERLEKAAVQIVPDGAARERILEAIKAKKGSRRRLSLRVPAAVLAACLLVGLLWFSGTQSLMGEEFVVYAATEENGWQKLEEGERILLKQETYETIREGEEIEYLDVFGRCNYYPYKCTFRVEIPEDYLYDNKYVEMGHDVIFQYGDITEWWLAPAELEDAGKVRHNTIRIWIVSERIVKDRRERIAALDVELTKEDGKCYAELKRVWESSAYKEYKRNKR